MKKQILLLSLLFLSVFAISQDKKKAKHYFYDLGDYESAVEEYLELVEQEPENVEYNYNLAISYLNSNIDKSAAIPYLEKLTKMKGASEDVYYFLGRAYALGYQFDKAIEAYKKFLELSGKSNILRTDVDRQIAYCQNAKELIKFPLNVKFENLGKAINSSYDDYFPFVPIDESFIIFNSNRNKVEGDKNELPQPDILISYVKDGKFTDAEVLPEPINTHGMEEVVGLNAWGTEAILYVEGVNNEGDLYECKIEDGVFGIPVKLDKNINSKYVEIAGCISSDNSRFFFASDRPGGYGGVDIYMCQRLPNGKWSEAQNLGPTINTKQDEDFPNLSPDDKILYFSSRGHTGMGGYDIYKAKWDDFKKKFVGTKNMGYPINTPDDDMNFRVSENGKYGYISTLRAEGLGGLDVYRVTFEDVEPNYTAVSGKIIAEDGKTKFSNLFIQIADAETDDVYGDYQPDERTLRYVMILPPGKYIMYVEADGYEMQEQEIEILDKASFKNYMNKDIHLVPAK